MNRGICIITVLLTGLLTIPIFGGNDKKIIEKFKVNWESIQYNKSATLYNLKVSSNNQSSNTSETMSLYCQIETQEPNLTIGTSQSGIITGLKDNKGKDIILTQGSYNSRQMSYVGLRYRQRFTQPPQMSLLELIRRLFRIPTTPFTPQLVEELQPPRLNFQLNIEMLESADIKSIDLSGYFYALMADSVEYIDIPFEPNNTWVRLTDDLEIRIIEAQCTLSGSRLSYNYEIEPRDSSRFPNRLTAESSLPERIVLNQLFVKQDGELVNRRISNRLPFNVGGGGSGSSSGSSGLSPIEKIRFVIAVKPSHQKIPFELKNIPLPALN
ncbi:hypothetical protein ACFLZ8_00065 [Planctomycetota bacterium]